MNFLNLRQWSVERRMVFAFVFIGLIVFGVAFVGRLGNGRLSDRIQALERDVLANTVALQSMDQGQYELLVAERTLLNPLLDQTSRFKAQSKVNQGWQLVETGLSEYHPSLENVEEQRHWKDLDNRFKRWRSQYVELLKLMSSQSAEPVQPSGDMPSSAQESGAAPFEAGQPETGQSGAWAALERQRQAVEQAYDRLSETLTALRQDNRDRASRILLGANQDIHSTEKWVLVGLTIGPLVSVVFAIYFSRLVAKPLGEKIARVVEVAQRISSGDLTTQIQDSEGDGSLDEVGQLFSAFHRMNGDLNNLVRQVQQAGIQVSAAINQISASGKDLEATFSEQVASTSEVSATAREIAARSGQLMEDIGAVAQQSQAAAVSAGGSQKELSAMEGTMRQLAQSTSSISGRLGVISEKANNITSVVTTIAKVADQTNLLSLNAAIEAEKAGEYGRGFAVVSREIRRLADQTAVSTLDIEHTVKEMQTAVAAGVMEMDKFTQDVRQGVDDIKTISSQLGQTIRQVKNLTPRFDRVGKGMAAQASGAQQISEAMGQLNDASLQTADALQEINEVLDRMGGSADQLQLQISRFKVSDDAA
jgi:methyl-accepting chemotaxis protein WspA